MAKTFTKKSRVQPRAVVALTSWPLAALAQGRLACDEVDRKGCSGCRVRVISRLDALHERFGGELTEPCLLLAHRRERRVRHGGHLHVVEADHRDVLGDALAG